MSLEVVVGFLLVVGELSHGEGSLVEADGDIHGELSLELTLHGHEMHGLLVVGKVGLGEVSVVTLEVGLLVLREVGGSGTMAEAVAEHGVMGWTTVLHHEGLASGDKNEGAEDNWGEFHLCVVDVVLESWVLYCRCTVGFI